MIRLQSSSLFGKFTKKGQVLRRPLILTLFAIAALGAVSFSLWSVPVYSSGPMPTVTASRSSVSDLRANNLRKPAKLLPMNLGRTADKIMRRPQTRMNHRFANSRFLFSPVLPAISATKTDFLLVDVNGDLIANPGDTLKYTVTITNSGTSDATGVMFSDTPDANTMLVPGSVVTTPIAIDDAYTATGNIRISVPAPGVLGNDQDADGDTFTASAGATSTNGGNVSVNGDGSFTYNPPPGFEGIDTFTYTLTDSHGNTDSGMVTITVSGMIWFVDSAAAAGDGRLTSPFNCLVGAGCFQPVAADDPGDNIFLYSGSYFGGLTLLANQKLIGQGATMPLATIAGITPAPNSDPLPSTGGANPVITTVAAATNGVNVGANDLIRGLTIGDTTGAGISGSSFGTLTVLEVIVNGLGQALNLSTGTLDASFGSLESINSSTTGITLSGVGGSLSAGSTNIQNSTGIGISISTLGTGVSGVNLANTTVNGTGSTGVSLTNNTGNVTFADLDITPDPSQRAFLASNAASVLSPGTIKITSGAISTTNAPVGAITITGATAALRTPIDIVLDSVSAINTISTIASGITITNTSVPGAGGGFTIQGSGTTAGSGGTIQLAQQGAVFTAADNITLKNMNFINANTLDGGAVGATCSSTSNLLCKAAINLNTVATATLDNLFVDKTIPTGGVEDGINGRIVSNLTINNTTVQNYGDQNNEGEMRFFNLTGTCAFTNSTFKFAPFKVVDITNDTGTLNLTVSGSAFSDTQTPATGADGLSVRAQLGANITLNVLNSTFNRLKTVGVNVISQNTATVNANITGSSFDPVAPGVGRGVDVTAQNTAVLNFNVNNNPKVYSNGGNAVNIFAVDSAVVQGRVNNNPDIQNVITSSGSGIVAQVNQNATLAIEIIGNTISNIGVDRGIQAFSRLKTSGAGGRLDATITGNNVTVGGAAISAIDIQAGGVGSTDTNELCANVRTNTTNGAAAGSAFRETTGSVGSTVFMDGFTLNATTTWNLNLNTPLNSVTESNAGTLTGGTCNVPSNPSAMLYYQLKPESTLARAPAKLLEPNSGIQGFKAPQFNAARPAATTAETRLSHHSKQTVQAAASKASARNSRANARKNAQPAAMHHAVKINPMMVSPSVSGSVNLNIGTLPAGESVTITFNVTINNPLPSGTTQVANQGTVSGSNFSSVLTDDPDTGTANDPTVTPVAIPNTAPVLLDTAVSLNSVAEDAGAPVGAVGILVSSLVDLNPPAGGQDNVTDSDAGAVTGMAVIAADATNGSWFYSINNGANWFALGAVSNTSARVLKADTNTRLYFQPNADFNGTVSSGLTFRAWDQFDALANGTAGVDTSSNGGSTAYSTATDVASITVTEVNDAPVAGDDPLSSVAEDSGTRTIPFAALLGNDSRGPANENSQTLTITAVSNAVGGSVSISGTDVLFMPTADYNGPASFDYTVQDDGTTNGVADPKTDVGSVSFTITEVNDAPDAVDDALSSIAEDSGTRTIPIATLLSNDLRGPANENGQTLTLTAVGSAVGGTVTFDATNVYFSPTLNYNGPASFQYTVQDNGTTNGAADPKTDMATVSFTITGVNDPPVANAGPDQTTNCSGPVMLNGTATTDVDNPNSALTFVWKEGATVIATGETATVMLPTGVHTITLTVTDPGGLSSQDTVVITVVDTSGPTITMTNAQIALWPPDHDYRTINLTDLVASASDACDPSVDINDVVITKVTSDEAEDGPGDGNTLNDIVIAANCKSAQLRAERQVNGNGRVYTFTFQVRDTSGNTTTATAKVTVPKTQSGAPAVDDGPMYTVLSLCPVPPIP